MPPQLHSTLLANHRPYADVYLDAADRLAATGFPRSLGGDIVPFATDDLYKKALQLDNASEWILTAITPTWVQIAGGGLTPTAHAASHQNGGSDEISVAGLSGVLADPQIADKIRESSGPTTLTVGAVADGDILKRVGSTLVGDTPGGGGGAILTEDLSDDKISTLPAASTMLNTDLLVIVDDPAGTAVTKRITKAEAFLPEVNQGENFGSATKRWAVTFSAQFNAKAGDEFRFHESSRLIDIADGFLLYRSHSGGAVKLSLGGTGNTAAMIKQNGTLIETRLGDDSAYGPLMAGSVRTNPVTFANLPGTPVEGMLVTVTDSSTATWGATITGGGANRVLAYYNGTNWKVAAI